MIWNTRGPLSNLGTIENIPDALIPAWRYIPQFTVKLPQHRREWPIYSRMLVLIKRYSIPLSIHQIHEKTRRRAAIEFESALGNKKSRDPRRVVFVYPLEFLQDIEEIWPHGWLWSHANIVFQRAEVQSHGFELIVAASLLSLPALPKTSKDCSCNAHWYIHICPEKEAKVQ